MTTTHALDHPPAGATLATTTGRRAPQLVPGHLIESRVRALIEIAERHSELVDPLNGHSGVRGDGESVGMTRHEARCLVQKTPERKCTCAYRGVTEFDRLVHRLRDEHRELWWHLDGWWLSARTRTVWHCPRCGLCHQPSHRHPSRRNKGKLVDVKCSRVIVWSRVSGAQRLLACRAVEWIACEWAAPSEPQMPVERGMAA